MSKIDLIALERTLVDDGWTMNAQSYVLKAVAMFDKFTFGLNLCKQDAEGPSGFTRRQIADVVERLLDDAKKDYEELRQPKIIEEKGEQNVR